MEATTPQGRADARSHYDSCPYEVGVDAVAYLHETGDLGRFLRSVEGGRALDVGCGPANLLPALVGRAHTVIGVDISAVSLRRAAVRVRGGARLVQTDARRLPFRDASVEHVVATGSLHHTGDTAAAFAEVGRVLGPGGRAFVSVYAAGSYYQWLYRTVGALARRARTNRASHLLVNQSLLLPAFAVYFVLGRLVARKHLELPSRDQLRNYFADQLLNEAVTFHSAAQFRVWAGVDGLELTSTSLTHAGALLQVVVAKPADRRRSVNQKPPATS